MKLSYKIGRDLEIVPQHPMGKYKLPCVLIGLCLSIVLFSYLYVTDNIKHTASNLDVSNSAISNLIQPKSKPNLVLPNLIAKPNMQTLVEALQAKKAADSITAEKVITQKIEEPEWETVTVQPGDNLALIFKRKKLTAQDLINVMSSGKESNLLKRLKPNEKMFFLLIDNALKSLRYDTSLTETLEIKQASDGTYSASKLQHSLQTKVRMSNGVIEDSLFLSAKKIGLSDKVIMQMIELYSWDIDFALEVQQNDKFRLIYEEHYKDGKKTHTGSVLAAEFINRGRSFKALRYVYDDGSVDYYTPDGSSMRKAFLRTPIKFASISSHFSLKRKHPILNKIRAHKGVDYAAPHSTSIKATGDGIVKWAKVKGGYGKAIEIQHGKNYTTLYGHLSAYAKGIKAGTHVEQGRVIGYVGMTGLATGPHLHYEFRINGKHKNPVTIKLPKALKIPDNLMPSFKQQTKPLLAQITNDNNLQKSTIVVALNEEELITESSRVP